MNVLFFSVSIGAGHHKAAEAMNKEVLTRYPQAKTQVVDTLKYINPVIDRLIVKGYLNTLKNTPLLYKKLYEMSDTGENLGDISNIINRFMSFRLKKLIKEFKPDVIVCTHPFPLQMISQIKRKNEIRIPLVAILTDFITHSFWLQPNVDAYIVSHEYMKRDMIKKGIREEIIHPVGIPVMSNFILKGNRKDSLDKFGLDDKPTFLLMGGGLGIGEIEEVFNSLLSHPDDIQIVVIAGRNSKLRKSLQQKARNTSKKIKVMSITSKVYEWMDVADFLITKPGGITVSEALCKNVPIIIISPIPGQEEKNANFLVNQGVALRIFEEEDIEFILFLLRNHPEKVKQIKESQTKLAKPGACEKVLEILEQLRNEK